MSTSSNSIYTSNEATSSQITLVNPPKKIKLLITKPDCVLNNTLSLNGRPRYSISTSGSSGAKTLITDARTNEVVVKIARKCFFPDEITFARYYNEGKAVKAGKEWFVPSKRPDGRYQWTMETKEGRFLWRLHRHTRWTITSDTDLDTPIAWLQLPTKDRPHALVITPGIEHLWDVIVGGWAYLEHIVRLEEKFVGGGSFGITI